MTQTVQISNTCDFLTQHLIDVFDTMLSFKVSRLPGNEMPHFNERVTGSVGFAGESVHGVVYIHLSEAFAKRAAAAMLGMAPEEISGEAEVNDVVGEVTNMLTGGFKSWLCDAGLECAVSTPAIIRGRSFAIESSPEVERAWLLFDCGGEHVIVEVHIKLN